MVIVFYNEKMIEVYEVIRRVNVHRHPAGVTLPGEHGADASGAGQSPEKTSMRN